MRPLPFACVLESLGTAVLVEKIYHSKSVRLTVRAASEFYQGDVSHGRLSSYVGAYLLGNPLAKQLTQLHVDRWVSDVLSITPNLLRSEMHVPAVVMASGDAQFVFVPDSHIDLETGQAWPAVRLRTQLPSGEEIGVTRFYRGGEHAYQRRCADFNRICEQGEIGRQQIDMYAELRGKLPESVHRHTSEELALCPYWKVPGIQPEEA